MCFHTPLPPHLQAMPLQISVEEEGGEESDFPALAGTDEKAHSCIYSRLNYKSKYTVEEQRKGEKISEFEDHIFGISPLQECNQPQTIHPSFCKERDLRILHAYIVAT